jgi:hypothetical protein
VRQKRIRQERKKIQMEDNAMNEKKETPVEETSERKRETPARSGSLPTGT